MLVRFLKNAPSDPADRLICIRPDGTTTWSHLPRQGILPHDAFHFVIETTLEWRDALFGHVARGDALDRVSARLHDTKHNWAKATQALHSEALVECLQADQWGGASDPAAFAGKLVATCRRRGVPPPDIDATELTRVRTALREFGAAWRPLGPGQSIERTF
ncbi:MAG: hypothetical protein NTV51_14000 [Verrucomicrobia bacterium]|nr:hypothetical protein [Verrucomicrobiota bacterium]